MDVPRFGRYEVLDELGRGASATVYRARDEFLGREVAIKALSVNYLNESTVRARFQREAQILARLRHEGIVPIFDIGEQDGRPYLVMAYMNGGTLLDRMDGRPMPYTDAITILNRVAGALDYAHAAGVIHRDLKPANVLFDEYGRACVADFGVGRLAGGTTGLTTPQLVIGTAAYMSPEQARGDPSITSAADIYALGAMTYELLAGRPVFVADSPFTVMRMHIYDIPPGPGMFNPIIRHLDAAILWALAKEPAARPPTAAAYVQRIEQAWKAQQTSIAPMASFEQTRVGPFFPPAGRPPGPAGPPPTVTPPPAAAPPARFAQPVPPTQIQRTPTPTPTPYSAPVSYPLPPQAYGSVPGFPPIPVPARRQKQSGLSSGAVVLGAVLVGAIALGVIIAVVATRGGGGSGGKGTPPAASPTQQMMGASNVTPLPTATDAPTRAPGATTPAGTPTPTVAPTRTPTPRPPLAGPILLSQNFDNPATTGIVPSQDNVGRSYFENGKLVLQRYSTGNNFVRVEYFGPTIKNVGIRVDAFTATGFVYVACRDDRRYAVRAIITPQTQSFDTVLWDYSKQNGSLYSHGSSPYIKKETNIIEFACRGDRAELIVNGVLLASDSIAGTGDGRVWLGVEGPGTEGATLILDNLVLFQQ